jgi:hypothetical protein
MINHARGVFCQGRFPRLLCRRLLCRFPLVILQQAAQSFPALHCSLFPSCVRLKRKQYAIFLALMVPLFMVISRNERREVQDFSAMEPRSNLSAYAPQSSSRTIDRVLALFLWYKKSESMAWPLNRWSLPWVHMRSAADLKAIESTVQLRHFKIPRSLRNPPEQAVTSSTWHRC